MWPYRNYQIVSVWPHHGTLDPIKFLYAHITGPPGYNYWVGASSFLRKPGTPAAGVMSHIKDCSRAFEGLSYLAYKIQTKNV